MTEVVESNYFIKNQKGESLYCNSFEPNLKIKNPKCIVVVPPVGHDRVRCYRECINLARSLAESGILALRFDFRGEGESGGIFEQSNINTRVNDIITIMKMLYLRYDVSSITLIGFRLGALICLIAAKNRESVILCEPILNMKSYTKSLFRANIIMQQDYFGKISEKEDDLRVKMLNGNLLSVYGFHYSNSFIKQMEKINENELLSNFRGKTLLLPFSRVDSKTKKQWNIWFENLNHSGKCIMKSFVTEFAWSTKKKWTSQFEGMSTIINDWLMEKI